MTNPAGQPQSFEPTLGLVFSRIAAMKQDKTFRPGLPLWAAFNQSELDAMFGKPEEIKDS